MFYSIWTVNFLKKWVVTLVLLLLGLSTITIGQTLNLSVDLIGVGSSSSETPFWIQSNRYGQYSSEGSQIISRIQAHGSTVSENSGSFEILYGADLIARPGSRGTFSFNQAYLKLRASSFELTGGRFHSTSPIHDEKLSMGSLGVSGNAVPVPQIRIGLENWTGIPYTNNYIQIRGHVAHGWLEKNRYTQSPLYHEKVGHVRLGGDFPLNFYGGLAHYAMWGGKNNPAYGDLPAEFSDFFRVFIGVGGDIRAPEVEADYLLGDHLGAWDFGFFLDLETVSMTFYRQLPLETKDNLKLKSLQDALNGLSIRFDESLNFPIDGLTYEFMYTKWQDGPQTENILEDGTRCSEFPELCRDSFQGNENYYNHSIYRDGWATHGRTIGNPLFRTSGVPVTNFNYGIINNRIVAHHLGAEASILNTNIVGKVTFSRNYGIRDNPFPEPVDQLSIGLTMQRNLTLYSRQFTLLSDVALDSGDLFGTQVGLSMGLRWYP